MTEVSVKKVVRRSAEHQSVLSLRMRSSRPHYVIQLHVMSYVIIRPRKSIAQHMRGDSACALPLRYASALDHLGAADPARDVSSHGSIRGISSATDTLINALKGNLSKERKYRSSCFEYHEMGNKSLMMNELGGGGKERRAADRSARHTDFLAEPTMLTPSSPCRVNDRAIKTVLRLGGHS
ncbi:hypothetical protein J6590_013904 [Homalodisca vitripennis]|nr:hypothetical protein J6590_013904 [Homalodisca vitripennis]